MYILVLWVQAPPTIRRRQSGEAEEAMHAVQVPTIRVDRYLAVLMLYNSRAMDRRRRGPRVVSVCEKKKGIGR